MTRRARRGLRALAVVVVVATTASCTAMSRGGDGVDGAGAASGFGTVVELAAEDRAAPVVVEGTTVEGEPMSTAAWRGQVVVLNLWYAACGPCRAEADDLAAVAQETAADGVQFLGINTRDGADEAAAFQRRFAVPYPSLLDASGRAVLALRGQTVPNAVPTTLVLDRSGRVAARVTGETQASVLRALVVTVVGEG